MSADLIVRPTWRFMLRHPAHVIALGFGAGLAPRAPGTAGTLLAWVLHWMLAFFLTAPTLLALLVPAFALGVWACARTGRALGAADHGAMVWDEIVAFMLVLVFTPTGNYAWQATGFVLFRVFDILKPPPIRYFDQTLKGGFGVMFDDLLAAFFTLLALAAVKVLMGE
jgi:phosphatidylglycerophosphatase A